MTNCLGLPGTVGGWIFWNRRPSELKPEQSQKNGGKTFAAFTSVTSPAKTEAQAQSCFPPRVLGVRVLYCL